MALKEGAVLQGAGAKHGCIYSVVFTEENDKKVFEIFLLKGIAKSHEEMALDLQTAKDWLDGQK